MISETGEVSILSFLISAIDGSECSTWSSGLLYRRERNLVSIEVEAGWVPESDWTFWRRVHLFPDRNSNSGPPRCSMVATPATLLQPISYHLMLNNSEPDEGSWNKLGNTTAIRKVPGHFEYLENRSRGLDITWQPVRGDLTVHLWTVTLPWG